MRQLKKLYVIAAHSATVSDVCFFRPADAAMPFPRTLKPEAAAPPTEPAMGNGAPAASGAPDVSPSLNGLYLATSGYDGLVKMWSADDWQLQHAISVGGSDTASREKVMSVDLSRGVHARNVMPADAGRRRTLRRDGRVLADVPARSGGEREPVKRGDDSVRPDGAATSRQPSLEDLGLVLAQLGVVLITPRDLRCERSVSSCGRGGRTQVVAVCGASA